MKTAVVTIIICFLAVELIEHVIIPLFWFILKGRKKSDYNVTGMAGKIAEVKQWNTTEGQVLVNGELWKAICETPLPVGSKAEILGIEGLTLRLKPHTY
ncbi:MAG: NfeD family protein [Desulfobacterales bacterium]